MTEKKQNIKSNKNEYWFVLVVLVYLFAISCKDNNSGIVDPKNEGKKIVILYTNDEHGWMEPTSTTGGAAGMVGLWHEKEGYTKDGAYLILSGGDQWTGPAISTWYQGDSMAEVMNQMNYTAAAIGNHEFDFKIEELQKRVEQLNFPLLSANIREKSTGKIPDFATPYIIKEVDGVVIGIIGLTTTTTPLTTFPTHVIDYDFIPYSTALNEIVPKVKSEGTELLIVIGHICENEMEALVPLANELGISVIGGGHCHALVNKLVNGVALIEGGSFMQNYGKVEIWFDDENNKVNNLIPTVHNNIGGSPDAQIATIVAKWKTKISSSLSEVIGYTNKEIDRHSTEMYNMITDSWLITFPDANVSLTNTGGIRQSIPAGEITLETIVGVLPFANSIVKLELTGDELIGGIRNLVVGGMTTVGGYKLSDGTSIKNNLTYNVLTTDYLYARPDFSFQNDDPSPNQTSVHYRQPTIDWIRSLNTSASNPINNYLDFTARR
ncbi:MAG: bifunctional UDP-sugar hydrolase/5'-nucleotidase [Melioribacteraceae bacterium]